MPTDIKLHVKVKDQGLVHVHPETNLKQVLDEAGKTLEDILKEKASLATATTALNGLMSSTDKSKLNGIALNANNYSLPIATASVLGGVKIGTNIAIASGIISVANGTTAVRGVVQLTDSITSPSIATAATPKSVKTVNDALNTFIDRKDNPHGVSTEQVTYLGQYVRKVTDDYTMYPLGLSTMFVRSETEGWISYGTVTTSRSFTTGGSTLQVYTPYSAGMGGTLLRYRIWEYQATDWSIWHTLETTTGAQAKVTAHANNTTMHITAAERTFWNAKASTAVATATANGLMALGDKSKLDGIAVNANNYTHPTSHPASMITGLAPVATGGKYSDLTGLPSLGTVASKNTGTTSGTIPIIGSDGKLDLSIMPATTITDTFVVGNQTQMLAVNAQVGDIAVRTDLKKTFILKVTGASTLANWQELLTPTDVVTSVAGRVGAVVLTKVDVGLNNVSNVLQAAKVDFDNHVANMTMHITATERATWNNAENSVTYLDTRDANDLPSVYRAKGARIHHEFKYATAVQLTVELAGGTYVSLETHVNFRNASGGPVYQIALCSNNDMYVRTGNDADSAWSAWEKVIDRTDLNTHANNTTLHITAAERTFWNAKASTAVATASANGLMALGDKSKLDGIAVNANNYSLPTATASVLGGVKNGTNISNSAGVLSVANGSTTVKGVVQLTEGVTSTSTTTAATPNSVKTVNDSLNTHANNKSNPHAVTKAQVGLGNADNTSDANKPVSTATQTELNKKANKTETVKKAHLNIQQTSYRRSVVALCNVTNTNTAASSYTSGTIVLHRYNGLNSVVRHEFTMEKLYNTTKANYNGLTIGAALNTIRPCTFVYNGIKYGGLEIYITDPELDYADVAYIGDFDIFGLDYYDAKTSTAMNAEIANSINFTDIVSNNLFTFNNKNVSLEGHLHTKGQVGLGNVDNTSDANKPVSTATQTELNKKATVTDFNSHTGNTTAHITAAERTTWNAKASTAVATTSANGLMISTDKSKLDGIAANANNYSLPTATASVLGGVKNGANISNNAGVLSVADGTTSAKGVVQLTDSTASASTTTAATANSVKAVSDRLATHGDNTTVHITAAERTNWNTANTAISYIDNRTVNDLPSIYRAKGNRIHREFKSAATIGITAATGAYIALETHVAYKDTTGGPIIQVAYTPTSKIFIRYSTASDAGWTAWVQMVDAADLSAHTTNTTMHITGAERTTWNAKATTAVATASANGLMIAADKSKLDGIAAGANNYSLPTATTAVRGGVILNNTVTSTDATQAATANAVKTVNDKAESLLQAKGVNLFSYKILGTYSGGTISAISSFYSVNDLTVTATAQPINAPLPGLSIPYAKEDTITVSGYITGTTAGQIWIKSANTTQFSVSANAGSDGYFKVTAPLSTIKATSDKTLSIGVGNNTAANYVLSHVKLEYGSVATPWSPSPLDIRINEATTSANGLMSTSDKSKLNNIAANANNYSLPTSTASVLGGVKTGTNIVNSSGTISVADGTTSAKGVVQLTDSTASASTTTAATANSVKAVSDRLATHGGDTTVHITAAERTAWNAKASTAVATTAANGLMAAADKTKLNGIATGANNYSLPASTASVLGGVKTGTNIVNSSGTISVADGTLSAKGVVQLTDSIVSTSTTTAATASSVKAVNDRLTAVTFKLPTSAANTYYKVAELTTVVATSESQASFLIEGLGGFGTAARGTALCQFSTRGDVLTSNVRFLNEAVTGVVFKSIKNTTSGKTEIWVYAPTYTYGMTVIVLGSSSNASVAHLSTTTTAPSGLTDIPHFSYAIDSPALTTKDGLMTAADKVKLNGIATGAQVNAVTTVAGRTGAIVLAKGDVGLGSVDNTSDANKPISTATQTALNGKASTAVATTAANGLMAAADKTKLNGIAAGAQVNAVTTVAGKTGAVVLAKGDVGLGSVDNTSDVNKPVSTATKNLIETYNRNGITSNNHSTVRETSVVLSLTPAYTEALRANTGIYSLTFPVGNFSGIIKVEATSTYSHGNANGGVVAYYHVGYNSTAKTFYANRRDVVSASDGFMECFYVDKEFMQNSTTGQLYLRIYKRPSTFNGLRLKVTLLGDHEYTSTTVTGLTLTYADAGNATYTYPLDYLLASPSEMGYMSSADKNKLNSVATGANNYSLPAATTAVRGGVILNNTVTSTDTTQAATANAAKTAYDLAASKAGTAVATTAANGLMAAADKTKLNGIAAGAQVNAVTTVAGRTGAVVLAKGDVGLGNVDNTSDANKPISTATQTALNGKASTAVATTAANGLMAAADKTKLNGIAAGAQVNAVTTVAGRTGAVVLAKADVGLGSVDNTTDANKPVSTATQNALNNKADKSNPVFTGGITIGGMKLQWNAVEGSLDFIIN